MSSIGKIVLERKAAHQVSQSVTLAKKKFEKRLAEAALGVLAGTNRIEKALVPVGW